MMISRFGDEKRSNKGLKGLCNIEEGTEIISLFMQDLL